MNTKIVYKNDSKDINNLFQINAVLLNFLSVK